MSHFSYERDVKNGTETWLTPRWITDPLGAFDLDPCGHPNWPIATEHYIWPESDGLMMPWHGRIFCNPPYGTQADAWANRMVGSGNGYLLLFARTETQMFKRFWTVASGLFFFEGRIRFHRADGSLGEPAPAPSVLIAFGEENSERLLTVTGWKGALVKTVRVL
jgi:hypothetical protein